MFTSLETLCSFLQSIKSANVNECYMSWLLNLVPFFPYISACFTRNTPTTLLAEQEMGEVE